MASERQIPEVGEEIHLPGPSAQPLMLALGTTIALIGVTQTNPIFFIAGAVIMILTLFVWIRDAIREFKALPDSHDDHAHDAGHGHAAPAPSAAADPTDDVSVGSATTDAPTH